MLEFTETARNKVVSFIDQGVVENAAVRVSAGGSPLAPHYDIALVELEDRQPDDTVVSVDGFEVLVDSGSTSRLEGATVDYLETDDGAGFQVSREAANGASGVDGDGSLEARVKDVIEREINPAVASHGGRITLHGVQDDVVFLEMSGGCQGCGMAKVTLTQGVERMIKKAVPEIVGIRDVTDHAAGENPFFQASK